MYFTIESDREVSVSGIGVLKAGEPYRLSAGEIQTFEIYNNTKLVNANFPYYVSVTAVVENEEVND